MENYIYNEKNGLWYELQGDYYLPCLKLPEEGEVHISLEKLKTAIDYGADAVYIGGEMFSLRVAAENFSKEVMFYSL